MHIFHLSFPVPTNIGRTQGDYELPKPFEVVFPANISKSLDQKCINITTRDDNDLEGGHDFTVTIVSTTPKISDDSSLNVVIFDNEGIVAIYYNNKR